MSRFSVGQRARIVGWPAVGHQRIPAYARGQIGVIERVLRETAIPADDALGPPGTLYRVRLQPNQVWSDSRGPAGDVVTLVIDERWLEPLEKDIQ